jgi:anti-anti-sigma regulatory factor
MQPQSSTTSGSSGQPGMPAAGATDAKLTVDKFADGDIACLRFAGTIDESFEGKKLAASVKAATLVLDLGGVKKISSFGIREWVDFISSVGKQVQKIILIECTPKVVDQLNMVANFAGGGRVFSFYAPFRCDYCDSEHRVLQQVDRDHDAIKSMKLAERPCPSCKESMYFDEDGATFFSYLLGQERFELEPEIVHFLSTKLNYAVSDVARKLRVDKLIEGRATFIRLAGDLDQTFPKDKLAEGLEGMVVFDVGGVGRIEPAGAAQWRGFVQMVTPLVSEFFIIGATPPFAEKLGSKDDLGSKAQILSINLPFSCKTCATSGSQLVDVAEHYDVLRLATAPDIKCVHCKNALSCAASETLMTSLPGLPMPTATAEQRKLIKDLRERKPEKKKVATTVAAAAGAQKSSWWMPFAAAFVAVALAGGAFLGYRAVTSSKAGAAGLGKKISASAQVRPTWITSDVAGGAYCKDLPDQSLICVGVSSTSVAQDDALDEASDASLEVVANTIASKIDDNKWKSSMPKIWQSTRQAKLAAFDREPNNTQARREVRDARRAVARMLTKSAAGAVPAAPSGKYWEEYETSNGKRYLAFVQFVVRGADANRLAKTFAESQSALGGTVSDVYPSLGWRYPNVNGGAVVTSVGEGRLKNRGITDGYVMLEIRGRAVANAADFAKISSEEMTQLELVGGTLELKVQSGDTEPRSFQDPIAKKALEVAPGSAAGRPSGNNSGTTVTPGNVNVWDRVGGGKGPSRDDPNQ